MKDKQRNVDNQNREIRTKKKKDVATDDRILIESLLEEYFPWQRIKNENIDRRNNAPREKTSSQAPSFLPITEELPDTENRVDSILHKYLDGAVEEEEEEPFFLKVFKEQK